MTTAALAQRRRVTTAASKRHAPRAVPAADPPSGIVTAYAAAMLRVSRTLDDAIASELGDAGIPVRADAEGDVPFIAAPANLAARLARIVDKILGKRSLLAPIDAIAIRTSKWSRVQFARQVKASLGIDLPAGDPDMAALFADFRARNVALIRSLAADKVARAHKVLTEAGSSTRVEDLAKMLRAETGATASRAALIARDQVLKLNGEVTQARHVAAGVTEYVWRTSRDERVRAAHRELDGTRQRYGEPPVVDPRTGRREPPGRDFQCRCTAEPIIPGFDEAAPVIRPTSI